MSKIRQSELSKKEVKKMFELFYIKVNSLKTKKETADFHKISFTLFLTGPAALPVFRKGFLLLS